MDATLNMKGSDRTGLRNKTKIKNDSVVTIDLSYENNNNTTAEKTQTELIIKIKIRDVLLSNDQNRLCWLNRKVGFYVSENPEDFQVKKGVLYTGVHNLLGKMIWNKTKPTLAVAGVKTKDDTKKRVKTIINLDKTILEKRVSDRLLFEKDFFKRIPNIELGKVRGVYLHTIMENTLKTRYKKTFDTRVVLESLDARLPVAKVIHPYTKYCTDIFDHNSLKLDPIICEHMIYCKDWKVATSIDCIARSNYNNGETWVIDFKFTTQTLQKYKRFSVQDILNRSITGSSLNLPCYSDLGKNYATLKESKLWTSDLQKSFMQLVVLKYILEKKYRLFVDRYCILVTNDEGSFIYSLPDKYLEHFEKLINILGTERLAMLNKKKKNNNSIK